MQILSGSATAYLASLLDSFLNLADLSKDLPMAWFVTFLECMLALLLDLCDEAWLPPLFSSSKGETQHINNQNRNTWMDKVANIL